MRRTFYHRNFCKFPSGGRRSVSYRQPDSTVALEGHFATSPRFANSPHFFKSVFVNLPHFLNLPRFYKSALPHFSNSLYCKEKKIKQQELLNFLASVNGKQNDCRLVTILIVKLLSSCLLLPCMRVKSMYTHEKLWYK